MAEENGHHDEREARGAEDDEGLQLLRELTGYSRQAAARGGSVGDFRRLAPPVFWGTEGPLAADAWLRKIEFLLRSSRAQRVHWVHMAAVQFDGAAYDWWEATEPTFPAGVTWDDFKESFLAEYFSLSQRKALERRFVALKQGQSTVADYYVEFFRLSKFVPHLVPTDQARRERFVDGLTHELQHGLRSHRNATFREVLEVAKDHEVINREISG